MSALLLASGCYPEEQGDDDTGIPGGDDDTTEQGDDDTGDDDTGDDDSGASDDDDTGGFGDQDHDGYTVEDGDCDDNDASIYPGADEVCDEIDQNCNGQNNEHALDSYEPNDTTAHDLGTTTDTTQTLEGTIHESGDVDRWQFYVDDTLLGDFYVEAALTVVPADLNLALELLSVDDGSSLITVDDNGMGEGEFLHLPGDFWSSDAGTYELVITASWGYSCEATYSLELECSG